VGGTEKCENFTYYLNGKKLSFLNNVGLISLEIADKLSETGSLVFGWDSEWAEDFDINRNKYGGTEAFQRLLVKDSRSPKQIVILSHDKHSGVNFTYI
jgi:hypothetical protein